MKKVIICSSTLVALSISVFAAMSVAEDAITPTTPAGLIEFPLQKGQEAYRDIDGRHLLQYVAEQDKISTDFRDHGHPQYWGRIAGTSGDVADQQWLLGKFRQIGLTDVHAQPINMFLPQWAPKGWSVTLTNGGKETKLVSAQAAYGSAGTNGKDLDLEVVYVGLGEEADFVDRDVRGKAVLVVLTPPSHIVGTEEFQKRALAHGAAAILGVEFRDGNLPMQAYPVKTNLPTFHLGARDGIAIRDLVGSGAHPHVKISLTADWMPNEKTAMIWATLPGMTDETIYVWGHRDGWFEAAGDNGTGIATILGLAEHYAKIPKEQRRRTIIFLATDGHHNLESFGIAWLIANRAKLFAKTALLLNAEHTAQLDSHGTNSGTPPGMSDVAIPQQWYAGGPSRPQLTKIAADAFREFGVPLWSEPGATNDGDEVGWLAPFAPAVGAGSNNWVEMHYVTDTAAHIPWTGLQAETRAYAKIIDEVNKLPLKDLQRPEGRYDELEQLDPIIPASCQAWIKDSSAPCKP